MTPVELPNELKSTLQGINAVLAAGAAVGIVLGLTTIWRFTGSWWRSLGTQPSWFSCGR